MHRHEIERIMIRAEEALIHELHIVEEILGHRHPRDPRGPKGQRVRQVFITILNNQKFIIMDPLSLQNGFQAPINEALVDAKTLASIADATKVNKSRVSDSPAVALVDANGNLVAVAPGTGNLTVVNTWTYTDSETKESVTADETTTTGFVVTVTPEGVLQVVTLGQASAIPAPAASN